MVRSNGKPTIQDVGKEAGVSEASVSYVLSGSKHADRISPSTKRRILAAAAKLGYNRNAIAAALKRGYSDNIVILVVTWGLASGYSGITVQINRAAAARGLSTTVQVASDDEEAVAMLQHIKSFNPYGLLLVWDSANMPVDQLLDLASHGLPILDLLPSDTNNFASVTSDREQGGSLLVQHLVELGHRRIGMILDTTTRAKTNSRKLAGYKKGLESAGIEFDPVLLEEVTMFGFDAGCQAIPRLLERNPDVTAVIGINDPMAIGAMVTAQDMGIKVPGDLSVAGFGGHPEVEYVRPRLTSVEFPISQIGDNAVELLSKMRTDHKYTPESVYIPMELVVRESTGPVKN